MAKNRNKESTRYYSKLHEDSVAKSLGGRVVPNSGAIKFGAGDVVIDDPGFLIECKTPMTEKDSFSIKKEWVEKNRIEKFQTRKNFSAISFKFSPNGENLYIISEDLMVTLVESLKVEK